MFFFLDTALIAASLYVSYALRFDFQIPASDISRLYQGLVIVLIAKPLIFIASGMYRTIWRYTSIREAYEIFKAVSCASLMAAMLHLTLHGPLAMPNSIYILDWFFLFAMVTGGRLIFRVYKEIINARTQPGSKRTLIIGAGEAGNLLLKEIRMEQNSPYNVVGFIDDDPDKRNLHLSGVTVIGGTNRLRALIKHHRIEEVIFAIPSEDGSLMRQVLISCKQAQVRFSALPGINDIIGRKPTVSQIKTIDIEDLLGRKPVALDQTAIRNYLTGRRVLVTGAAGSIGSEICRQVARFNPAKLVLLDNAETPLFYIEKELTAAFPDLSITPIIGDVKNKTRIEAVFSEFSPEVVFHAAAYKHVAMMEFNPSEAVLNNVMGSRIVADAAHAFNVSNFVMVSSDKAVNPTNVMGATKRSAEIYVQALAGKSSTKFTTVRFGNVLGSSGSVIPIFKEQIQNGGPVTVTHKDVVRYFMTISEASQLVLQAGCIGKGGEIFVLDMGKPVRILSLAEELIMLSGFVPYKEIEIKFTGLKPGEKLYEELLIAGEGIKPTAHEMIRVMAPVETDLKLVDEELNTLFVFARASEINELIKSLKTIVPEFIPDIHFETLLPLAFKNARPDLFPHQEGSNARHLHVVRSRAAQPQQPQPDTSNIYVNEQENMEQATMLEEREMRTRTR
jgi:FlaA1/EpsC-like NDP-sugar epimerase